MIMNTAANRMSYQSTVFLVYKGLTTGSFNIQVCLYNKNGNLNRLVLSGNRLLFIRTDRAMELEGEIDAQKKSRFVLPNRLKFIR